MIANIIMITGFIVFFLLGIGLGSSKALDSLFELVEKEENKKMLYTHKKIFYNIERDD